MSRKMEPLGDVKGHDDVKREIERILRSNETMEKTVTKIKDDILGRWKTIPVNVCLFGERGTGKSSFINNMIGQNVAQTGVKETTTGAVKYAHPDNQKLCFWDMPGFGAKLFPTIKGFIQAMDVKRFDMILFLHKGGFKHSDGKLVTEIRKSRKPLFLIRTFFDIDAQDGNIEEVKNDIISEVGGYLPIVRANEQYSEPDQHKLYFISNRSYIYDYDNLMNDIFINLADADQRDAFYFSIENLTEISLQLKRKCLEKRVWIVATICAAAGVIPIPGVDAAVNVSLMVQEVTFMARVLGIYDIISGESTNENIKRCSKYISVTKLVPFITKFAVRVSAMAVDDVAKIVPVIGAIVSSVSNFTIAKLTLTEVLDDFITVAREKMIAERSQSR